MDLEVFMFLLLQRLCVLSSSFCVHLMRLEQQAIRLLGEQKAYDSMQRILRKLAPDRAETEKMLETAQSANDSRCVSILMNELQKHGRKQRKAFEL